MDQLLRICGPSDLHSLTVTELQGLADEIREVILSCVSEVGGHLAASLGAVELTVALHSVLDSPRDKIIWDVGHQAYAHKIITGRAECFNTIRQYGGLSGFPCRGESEHDVIGTGHASTSISYGLGLVEAAGLSGRSDGHVVCVLGDGALTGGVAFEAMNQAGQLHTPLVVVLNDNQMSIKPNVGAFQLYLNRFRLDPGLTRLREDMEHTIARIPAIGARAYSLGKDVKESMKAFLGPGLIFEELGFAYIGVVNGHDIGALRLALQQALDTKRPVLVHVRTVKGKGYEPAEEQPAEFHGTGPFKLANGERTTAVRGSTYTEAFGRVMVREARRDPRIVAITAAMTQGTGLEGFEAEFPQRLYDVGIAEEHAVVFAAGLALAGMRPVVAVYSTFLTRAFDQVNLDVGLHRQPVIFCLDRAGVTGDDGPSHHGVLDMMLLTKVPGMVVFAPSSYQELQQMFHDALELTDGPVTIRWPKTAARQESPEQIGHGLAGRRLLEGSDLCIISIGKMLDASEAAAAQLRAAGVSVTLWDARVVKPLDPAMLADAARHACVLTVEDGVREGGVGNAIQDQLAEYTLGEHEPRVRVLGTPIAFIPHDKPAAILAELGLDAAGITASAMSLLSGDHLPLP